ncbi:MAG: DUF4494 domain-containing protein [Crocinitomicaceae bacterium]|nr:DUF4494 domain-containing protein [Crocinitomicaceae bacterium]
MNSWYTVKVKYIKQFEDGRLKSVTEPYLVDAVSFTEAEARIYEELAPSIRGEFAINGIAKTDYADIFHYDDADEWYKCKVTYISVDADSGKEKKISQNFLVSAHSVKEAYARLEESLSGMMVSYDIPSVMLSPIIDIFPFSGEREVIGEDMEEEVEITVANNMANDNDFGDEDEEESEAEIEDEFSEEEEE